MILVRDIMLLSNPGVYAIPCGNYTVINIGEAKRLIRVKRTPERG